MIARIITAWKRILVRYAPQRLKEYEIARSFATAWTTCGPRDRIAMTQWALAPRIHPDGRVQASDYVAAFRLFGGVQNTFRLVFKNLDAVERERLTAAGVENYKTEVCPVPNVDDFSGAVIQIACVTNCLPPDLLGTVEGLALARRA